MNLRNSQSLLYIPEENLTIGFLSEIFKVKTRRKTKDKAAEWQRENVFNLSSWLVFFIFYLGSEFIVPVWFVVSAATWVNLGWGNVWWLPLMYVGTYILLITAIVPVSYCTPSKISPSNISGNKYWPLGFNIACIHLCFLVVYCILLNVCWQV